MKLGWRLAKIRASGVRRAYLRRAWGSPAAPVCVDYDVVSYSSERDLAEQIACIRSFLRYVGVPRSLTVVSDGSHTARGRRALCSVHTCVRVLSLDAVAKPAEMLHKGLPANVAHYLNHAPLGKKLRILMSINIARPTIYCDSDVLFFPGAAELRDDSYFRGDYYLTDALASLVPGLLASPTEWEEPVNSGFLLLNQPLSWKIPLRRLEEYRGPCEYWTEQTVVHLAVHASRATKLDPMRFVVRIDDKWDYRDRLVQHDTVLRHYVAGLRAKMWPVSALCPTIRRSGPFDIHGVAPANLSPEERRPG